jgi:hypothetical protein
MFCFLDLHLVNLNPLSVFQRIIQSQARYSNRILLRYMMLICTLLCSTVVQTLPEPCDAKTHSP